MVGKGNRKTEMAPGTLPLEKTPSYIDYHTLYFIKKIQDTYPFFIVIDGEIIEVKE